MRRLYEWVPATTCECHIQEWHDLPERSETVPVQLVRQAISGASRNELSVYKRQYGFFVPFDLKVALFSPPKELNLILSVNSADASLPPGPLDIGSLMQAGSTAPYSQQEKSDRFAILPWRGRYVIIFRADDPIEKAVITYGYHSDEETWGTNHVHWLCEDHEDVHPDHIRDVICGHKDSEQQRIATMSRALLHDPLSHLWEMKPHPTMRQTPKVPAPAPKSSEEAKVAAWEALHGFDGSEPVMIPTLKEGVEMPYVLTGKNYDRVVHTGVKGPHKMQDHHKAYWQTHADTVHPKGTVRVH